MIDGLAGTCVAVGLVLTAGGLYRRDPDMQLRARRVWGWFSLKVLRRRPKVHAGAGIAQALGLSLSAEGMTPPLTADPTLPLDERVTRLDENINILYRSIQSQAKVRSERDNELREKVNDINNRLAAQGDDLRRLVHKARAPEHMEWVGLTFLFVGAVLALFA